VVSQWEGRGGEFMAEKSALQSNVLGGSEAIISLAEMVK